MTGSAGCGGPSASSRRRTGAVVPTPERGLRGVAAGEGHQGPGGRDLAAAPHRGPVGERLHEQAHLTEGRRGAQRLRHRAVHDREELQEQVVPPAQVGLLVGDDRLELVGGQRVEHALREHHPGLPARDAVGGGGGVLQDPHPLVVLGDDVDELAVVGAHPPQPGADPVPGHQQPHQRPAR